MIINAEPEKFKDYFASRLTSRPLTATVHTLKAETDVMEFAD